MWHRIGMLFLILLFATGCESKSIRFATFNASLNREKQGQLLQDLAKKDDAQIKNVAEIIQRARPDVLLINEFDYDPTGTAIYLFQKNYLSVPQNGAVPIEFPYHYAGPVNTGVASGHDLDHDGKVTNTPGTRAYGGDALGFGLFPGQYGMVLLSKFPIDTKSIRTFQRLKWKQMPNAMLPADKDGKPWYDDEVLAVMRLSSKSHWDVPLIAGDKTIHVLASHPTPPAFDGPEDRNGKRNHDEIRLSADYVRGGAASNYIVDDTNQRGRGDVPLTFVLMGDQNADPVDGASIPGAINQLLHHRSVNSSFVPSSAGAAEAAASDAGNNAAHKSPAENDTSDFADSGNGPGNLRCDYVLPSHGLKVIDSGVYWPVSSDPLSRLVKVQPKAASSDHRLVWVDVKF